MPIRNQLPSCFFYCVICLQFETMLFILLSRLVAMNDKTCLFEINNGGHANEQCSWLLKVQTAWADMANV